MESIEYERYNPEKHGLPVYKSRLTEWAVFFEAVKEGPMVYIHAPGRTTDNVRQTVYSKAQAFAMKVSIAKLSDTTVLVSEAK